MMIDTNEGPPDSRLMTDGPSGAAFDDYGFAMTLSPGFNTVGSQMANFAPFDLDSAGTAPVDVSEPALYGQQQTNSLSMSSDAVPLMRDDDGFFGSNSLFPGAQQPDDHTSLFYSSDAVPTAAMGYFGSSNTTSGESTEGPAPLPSADPVSDELGCEWERKLDFSSQPQESSAPDYEEFNEESEQGADEIIMDEDSTGADGTLNGDQLLVLDPSMISSPSTNSPPSPTEAVQVGGKLCHVALDTVKNLVLEFRNILVSNREKYQCPRPRSNKALGYKVPQTRELFIPFYKEHISRNPVPTRIYTAYSMLRGEYREEKNAGVMVLAYNVNSLDDSHLHELTEVIDDKVRDWISCDTLATVLFTMVKRGRITVQPILDWMNSKSVWRQRCCCIAFSKLLHLSGTNCSDTVVSLCKTCLTSPGVPPLQTAAGVLLRELSSVDEALTLSLIRENLSRMDPSCLRMATDKLSDASKTKVYGLRSSTESLVLPGPDEPVWTATAKATKSLSHSDLPSPQLTATNTMVVPPARNIPVSPGRQKTKRQTKPKPSMTPPPSSPDLLKPVPTPMARRSLSSRFDSSAFGGNSSMFGAVSAALGASIMRPPSTPQHQTGSHHVTPTHSVSPTPSSTPTRKRPKAYNLSPALLKQNPTNQTLAAAVTASASAVNLDRCAPPLQDHLSSGGGAPNNGSNNASQYSRAAQLFYSNSSTVMGGASPFGIPRQSLSPARTQSVQQINMQRRQLQLQHQFPPRGLSPSRGHMPQPRSMSTPPYQFHRQQPSKRK